MDQWPSIEKIYTDYKGFSWMWVPDPVNPYSGVWKSLDLAIYSAPHDVVFMSPPWSNCDLWGVQYLAQP